MRQHNIWCVYVCCVWRGVLDCSPAYLSTQSTHLHTERTAVRHTSSHRTDCSPAHIFTQNGLQSGTHLHTERTYTHQILCCRITTLTFSFLTNFKISNFNEEHTSFLKMI